MGAIAAGIYKSSIVSNKISVFLNENLDAVLVVSFSKYKYY